MMPTPRRHHLNEQTLPASGLLVPKLYGAPVRPIQPDGVNEVSYGGSSWEASAGEDRFRRSLYTFQKRTAPFALFNTFDAPSGESCLARREVSNTPLQSLTMLNDPAIQEAALALGRFLLREPGDDSTRAVLAFRRVLVRPPQAAEVDRLTAFVAQQRLRLRSGELDSHQIAPGDHPEAGELATWTLTARALFNLDEFVIKP